MAKGKSRNLVFNLLANTASFMAGTTRAQKGIAGLASSITSFGKSVVQSFLSPIGILDRFRQSITSIKDSFVEFTKEVSAGSAAFKDAASVPRKEFEDVIAGVAKNTKFTTKDASDALNEFAKRGISARAAIAALPAAANLAQGANLGLATSVESIVSVMTEFNQVTDDAAKMQENAAKTADLLMAAQQNSRASIEDMVQAIGGKGTDALLNAGLATEELVAAYAALSNSGMVGAEASDNLNQAMLSLQLNAKKNADAFKFYGIEVFNQQGAMNSLKDILGQLGAAYHQLDRDNQVALLSSLGFSRKTINAIEALLQTKGGLEAFGNVIANSTGKARAAADRSFTDIERATKNLESIWLAFTRESGPALVQAFTLASTAIAAFLSKALELAKAFGLLMVGTDAMPSSIANVEDAFSAFGEIAENVFAGIAKAIDVIEEKMLIFTANFSKQFAATIFLASGGQVDPDKLYQLAIDKLAERGFHKPLDERVRNAFDANRKANADLGFRFDPNATIDGVQNIDDSKVQANTASTVEQLKKLRSEMKQSNAGIEIINVEAFAV